MKRNVLVLFLLIASVACRSAGNAPPVTATSGPPAADTAAGMPDSIRWMRDAAEYRAALWQVYRLATAHVESEALTRTAGTWAVILDADETVINNVIYQEERARERLPYSQESWRAWVLRREATPLPGAAPFLSRVQTLGGRIAIVTNRLQSECPDTEAVFKIHRLPYDVMLCRPDGGPSDKNPRFEAVAAGRTPIGSSALEVVAFVGDNILDFPGLSQASAAQAEPAFASFGVRFFVVPNSMYGSWQ